MTFKYPPTRTESATDILAGVSFADPYRWLEEDSPELRSWQTAQAQLASAHVREWPHFDRLRELVAHFHSERYVAMPRYAGGRWFRSHMPSGATQAVALVADEPMGEGRVLYDPTSEPSERPPFLSWIAPSPDGKILAVGVCTDGSEANTMRLIDVDTGRLLENSPPQTLMDNWTGGVSWLPDSSGFFFSGLSGEAAHFVQGGYLHRRDAQPETIALDIPWITRKDYRMIVVSSDGRYAVALERLRETIPVAIADLTQSALQWKPFVTLAEGTLSGHMIGKRYVAVTDVGASRGRLVAVDLDADDPNDPTGWQELVAESDAVLRAVTPVGEMLYLTEFVDTYARVRMVDHQGKNLGEVPLPDRGSITSPFPLQSRMPVPKGHPDKFMFGFSSLTASPQLYSHLPGSATIETLQAARVQLEDTIVEDCWAISKDGTRIPYHIVRRADLDMTKSQPTLIYVYGGLNGPLIPQFSGTTAAFVAAGGVYVHAHLRGGAEFGVKWWHEGRLHKKQNSYDDLYAVAEQLMADGVCTAQTLALMGGSNGGLTAGVAATQRPELWAVVAPRVPLLDLIGACRDPYPRAIVHLEFADIDDPEDVKRLATFSPYHLVRDGVRYPAIFLDAGDTDPRCAPWHARKFAARLQAANAGDTPILLHVWENTGHGWATDLETALTGHTEWLAFALRHLGADWPADIKT